MHREIRTEVIVSGDDGGQLSVGANLVGMRVDGARGNAVTVLPAGSAPKITPRRYPIRLMPRRTVPFFDRVDETQQMLAELTVHRSVVLQAPPGVGKTSLVRHIAHHPGLAAAYGAVVCLSARDQSCDDLLQALFSAFYTSDGPVRPNPDELRHLLRPVQGAVLLDDVDLPAGALAELQEFAPNCGFVLAGTHVNGARSGLSGLPVDAAGELLARVMGQPVDRTAVFALWGLSRGVPARLIQLGVSASAYPGGVEAFTELALHDGPPPFTVDAPEDRRLLGLLAAVPGVELTAEQLASIAEVPDAAPRLRRWVGRGVVTVSDAGLYRFAAGELDPVLWQLAERRAELVAAFATWARREPDTVLAVGGSAELVRSLQELALRQQAWRAVLALGAPLDAAYALAGHWDAWHSCLQAMLDAARALGDQAAEAMALHQLGAEAICRGDLATARDLLRSALDLRVALGQTEAAEITRENLATITDQPRSAGLASPLARIPMAVKVVAVLIPLLGSLAFVGVSQARATPKASFAPQRLAFTDQIVDHASAPQVIRLDNGGLAGLHVDGVVISGPNHGAFTLVGNSCVGEVPASGNCTATVVFTPATPGPQQASLSWRIREIPGDMASPLVGNGVAAASAATPDPGGVAAPSQVPVPAAGSGSSAPGPGGSCAPAPGSGFGRGRGRGGAAAGSRRAGAADSARARAVGRGVRRARGHEREWPADRHRDQPGGRARAPGGHRGRRRPGLPGRRRGLRRRHARAGRGLPRRGALRADRGGTAFGCPIRDRAGCARACGRRAQRVRDRSGVDPRRHRTSAGRCAARGRGGRAPAGHGHPHAEPERRGGRRHRPDPDGGQDAAPRRGREPGRVEWTGTHRGARARRAAAG